MQLEVGLLPPVVAVEPGGERGQVGLVQVAGSKSQLILDAQTIALTHHEHWDGNGYPQGLHGDQIPLIGRIVAICDVFDALISQRPHKAPWPLERAFTEIEELSGTHFDPKLTDIFLDMQEAIVDLVDKTA